MFLIDVLKQAAELVHDLATVVLDYFESDPNTPQVEWSVFEEEE